MNRRIIQRLLWILILTALIPAGVMAEEKRPQSILFLGDSIIRGRVTKDLTALDTIPSIVEKRTGVPCKNSGLDGARVTLTGNKETSLVRRLSDNRVHIENYTMIVLLAGTNDHGNNVKLGTMQDRSALTFYGAWHRVFSYIRKYNPDATVVVVTPICKTQRKSGFEGTGFNMKNKSGDTLSAFIKAERAIAKKYGALCFDPAQRKLITKEEASRYLKDGLHPNVVGYRKLGNALANYLKIILRR